MTLLSSDTTSLIARFWLVTKVRSLPNAVPAISLCPWLPGRKATAVSQGLSTSPTRLRLGPLACQILARVSSCQRDRVVPQQPSAMCVLASLMAYSRHVNMGAQASPDESQVQQ